MNGTNVLLNSYIMTVMGKFFNYLFGKFFLWFMLSVPLNLLAQDDIIFQDFVYTSNISSVEFKGVSGQTANFPVIQLNQGTLYFSFDDLAV